MAITKQKNFCKKVHNPKLWQWYSWSWFQWERSYISNVACEGVQELQGHGRPLHPLDLALYAWPFHAPPQPGRTIWWFGNMINDSNHIQTSKSIHEGIIKDAKALTGEQKLFDFSYYDYKWFSLSLEINMLQDLIMMCNAPFKRILRFTARYYWRPRSIGSW